MGFSKKELIGKGAHYFKDKKVKMMYATSDGNFFHESSKNYADAHAKSNKGMEVFEITAKDCGSKSSKSPDKDSEKDSGKGKTK